MGWRAGHFTIIVGTGDGAFANKNCPQGRAFEQFFQMPGVCPGVCPRGMLAAGIDSHMIRRRLKPLFDTNKPAAAQANNPQFIANIT